ncbi:phosphate ABC transporter substrate-binding protein PstS [Catenuloplanes atrovinosus]|uniref:Phosphate-binding protein n=1 Tax=Catenuloplanes atrovinosus TaxID=137266 RepID=A0AAE4CEW0_9ACTN|nr:phosphate ABC transporter substrate-binding protein PstS [Catenuloplanes atrovinosus]MDR7280439.1 phosphate transport system substrate-binding protein [Catenuloplanes atrovinosus]
MKLHRHGALACLALTTALALSACGSDNTETDAAAPGASAPAAANCATGTLNAQGSSAQKNAVAEWIKAYQTACAGSTINYEGTGSGAGINAFINGTADFAGSDSALKEDQQPQADQRCAGNPAIHLPAVIGPIAVVYNLDGVDSLNLTPATLAKIFAGKVTKWNAPEIAADNAGVTLPDTTINPVHRSDESGTTENFTKYLAKVAEADWTYEAAKTWPSGIQGGTGSKGSDGVASSVSGAAGAIGYVEMSFAENSDLATAKIQNGAGEFVELTPEAAGKTIEGAEVTGTGNDLKMSIDYATKTAGAYPIVLVTYEIACSAGNAADKLQLIKGFLGYAASAQGQATLIELGYAPLPESVRAKVETAVAAIA